MACLTLWTLAISLAASGGQLVLAQRAAPHTTFYVAHRLRRFGLVVDLGYTDAVTLQISVPVLVLGADRPKQFTRRTD